MDRSRKKEEIRDVILDPKNTEMDPRCEALLYAAARRQHLVEKVLPALEEGSAIGRQLRWGYGSCGSEGKNADYL